MSRMYGNGDNVTCSLDYYGREPETGAEMRLKTSKRMNVRLTADELQDLVVLSKHFGMSRSRTLCHCMKLVKDTTILSGMPTIDESMEKFLKEQPAWQFYKDWPNEKQALELCAGEVMTRTHTNHANGLEYRLQAFYLMCPCARDDNYISDYFSPEFVEQFNSHD